jgi:hypothetical protein
MRNNTKNSDEAVKKFVDDTNLKPLNQKKKH